MPLLDNFGVVVVLSSWERTSLIVSSVNALHVEWTPTPTLILSPALKTVHPLVSRMIATRKDILKLLLH